MNFVFAFFGLDFDLIIDEKTNSTIGILVESEYDVDDNMPFTWAKQ